MTVVIIKSGYVYVTISSRCEQQFVLWDIANAVVEMNEN
jgi:hypothetical protein